MRHHTSHDLWKVCPLLTALTRVRPRLLCFWPRSWSNKMVYRSTVHSITLSFLFSLFIWHLYLFFDSIHPLNATFYYLYSCGGLFGGQPILHNGSQTREAPSRWESLALRVRIVHRARVRALNRTLSKSIAARKWRIIISYGKNIMLFHLA